MKDYLPNMYFLFLFSLLYILKVSSDCFIVFYLNCDILHLSLFFTSKPIKIKTWGIIKLLELLYLSVYLSKGVIMRGISMIEKKNSAKNCFKVSLFLPFMNIKIFKKTLETKEDAQ